jgi:ribosome-associated protein
MEIDSLDILRKISQAAAEKKGVGLLVLEVGHFSTVTDYLVIVEGNVDRHVLALAHEIVKEVRDAFGIRPHHVEGLSAGEWVLIDYGDIIVHIFMPGMREKFCLESLWSMGKVVDLKMSLIA